jgi:antitoxin component of MazEF toxin-antitoxin module
MGNSSAIIIPKLIMTQIGIETGDDRDLPLDGDRIVLSRAKRHPRSGRADASKRIARIVPIVDGNRAFLERSVTFDCPAEEQVNCVKSLGDATPQWFKSV